MIFAQDIPDHLLLDKYAPAPSQFIDVNGIRIHYRDQGKKDGAAILMLHGSQASLHTWEDWVELLGDEFRLVSLDLPGHGFTGPMPGDDYSYSAIAALLHAFARGLSLPPFTLVGNSYGGAIAIQFAVSYPEDLSRMVLIDAAAYHHPDPLSCKLIRLPGMAGLFCKVTPRGFIRSELESCYSDRSKVTDAMFERYYELMLRAGNRRAQVLINKPEGAYWLATAVLNKLSTIRIPVLIMWGQQDPWLPVSLGERFRNDIPNAVLRVYQNCGHLPMEELPQESGNDLRLFMRDSMQKSATE